MTAARFWFVIFDLCLTGGNLMDGAEYRALLKSQKKKLCVGGKDVEAMTPAELRDAVYALYHALVNERNSRSSGDPNPLAKVLDVFFNGRSA
jgi:hypothetical protein